MQDLSIFIIPYEIYQCTCASKLYNIYVQVQHSCGCEWRQAYMQISARSKMKKQAVLEAQLEHLLCQGGTKLLQEPNLFCWNLSFFLFMTMLDENKCMWSVDLMPCWMETWFMWCYCFCARIFVSINVWKNGMNWWAEFLFGLYI